MNFKPVSLILGVVLLAGAFFAGAAWNTEDTTAIQEENTTTAPDDASVLARTANPATEDLKLTQSEERTIQLFEQAAPSAVYIQTSKLERGYFSTRATEVPRGSGTGFVWDKEGHIITNFHVIQGADRATVTFFNQSTYEASLVGVAPEKDLAVLKIDAPTTLLRPVPLGDSEKLKVGQNTYAIGNPFGLDQTLTTGIVSALGREIESVGGVTIKDVVQTDAAINPGNSGGPLLNSAGELIGVNTAIYSPSGAYAGIGFSIPVNAVKWVVPDLIQYGEINRPKLGIYPARQDIEVDGVLVIEVEDGGGADQAGIRPTYRDRYGRMVLGDIIIGINQDQITSYSDMILALEKYKPGDVVTVTVRREDQTVELEVTLGAGV